MKIIVIGAVAGGTSAAMKARRNDEKAEIVIYDKGKHISYSGCGMPFYLSGEVEKSSELTPRESGYFELAHEIYIKTEHEVEKIDPKTKTILVKDLKTGEKFTDQYDKLVIATGARARDLLVEGATLPHVFSLRTIEDMFKIDDYLKTHKVENVTVIGSGYVGVELVDSFTKRGMKVTLLEKMEQIIPNLDEEMAQYVRSYLETIGIKIFTGVDVKKITPTSITFHQGEKEHESPSELVLVAIGVKPNTEIASEAGIVLGDSKAIKVNEYLETNIKDIYAAGDCMESWHMIDKKPLYLPLGSTANKTGRIVGDNITGGKVIFKGVLGTAIFKVFDLSIGQTGKTEKQALKEGLDYLVITHTKPDRPHFMGGQDMIIKALSLKDGTIIGAQIVGHEGVDKRIDVIATTMTLKGKASDLEDMDLAYSPPFATARDPINYTGMILENALKKNRKLISAKELLRPGQTKRVILDIRSPIAFLQSHLDGAINIPQMYVRDNLTKLDKDAEIIVCCLSGWTSNAVQNILLNEGFKDVKNLAGGYVSIANHLRLLKNK